MPNLSIIEKLQKNPEKYSFFQATYLVENIIKNTYLNPLPDKHKFIYFTTNSLLNFPIGDIQTLQFINSHHVEIEVNFIGLTGSNGILPNHYSELLLKKMHQKDYGLKEFFNLFDHKTISLFYQVWQKYTFPYSNSFYRHKLTKLLAGLVGSEIPNNQFLTKNERPVYYYAGLFSQQSHNAVSLENILAEYFDLPVQIKPFQIKKQKLAIQDCTSLGSSANPQGNFTQLGCNTVLGQTVCHIQNTFLIKLGALMYKQFKLLLPNSEMLNAVIELTRSYINCTLQFDIELLLKKTEVPFCYLSLQSDFMLGRNTWLKSKDFVKDAAVRFTNLT